MSRVWSLDIDGKPFISSQTGNRQFRIVFSVVISPGQAISSADISIYNLSKLSEIPQGSPVVLRAGYDDKADIIFSGYVTNLFREREYTDIRTRLLCTSGGAKGDRGSASSAYGKNAKVVDVLQDLARSWPCQLDLDATQFEDAPLLTSGMSISGDIPAALDALGYQYNFDWVTERGRLVIERRNKPRRSLVVQVDQFNGMVGIPEVTRGPSGLGIFVVSTLNPALRSNSRINVISEFKTFNTGNMFIQGVESDAIIGGGYNVFQISHKGDNYSDQWITEIDALRAEVATTTNKDDSKVPDTAPDTVPTANNTPVAQPGKNGVLVWGKKVDQDFRVKVREIAAQLKYDPNWLMAVMAFETRREFTATVKNPGSSATGLIQFTNIAAKGLGTTVAKIGRMTAVQQLDLVRDYFVMTERVTGKPQNLGDCYMMVLWPAAARKPDSYVMWEKDFGPYQSQYNANSGLDVNKNGKITKGEAAAKVEEQLRLGAKFAM